MGLPYAKYETSDDVMACGTSGGNVVHDVVLGRKRDDKQVRRKK